MSAEAEGFCRDCLAEAGPDEARCRRCGSARLLRHPELDRLSLAHVDCDAFYAAVEKRDDPRLKDLPVIVGGGRRGVALTACYVARRFGVRSAMPMFKALQLCPQAVVVRPTMAKYAAVSRDIRAVLLSATPAVEPVSLDEAYLDLAGTESVHGQSPARTLARLSLRIEREVGIAVSIGLSHNKLLAKLASDMDKPHGFGVIGRAETRAFLASRPLRALPGIGPKTAVRLAEAGVHGVADIQALAPADLERRFGSLGAHLAALCAGEDPRRVEPDRDAHGMSAENTFDRDLSALADLEAELWPLAEKVSRRLKSGGLAGRTVVLKLKTSGFRILTRRTRLSAPTQLAETIWRAAQPLLARECDGRRYRLIGVGVADIVAGEGADPPDLLDPSAARRAAVERAIDAVRAKFGDGSLAKGRGRRQRRARSGAPATE